MKKRQLPEDQTMAWRAEQERQPAGAGRLDFVLARTAAAPPATRRRIASSVRGAILAMGSVALIACRPAAPDGLIGLWSVEFRGGDGIAYLGTLDVTRSADDGVYRGSLEMQFRASDGDGEYSAVHEDAWITVDGGTVRVNCTRPVVLTEDTDYIPDNFFLTRLSQNVLQGYEKDVKSIGGTVTLTKVRDGAQASAR